MVWLSAAALKMSLEAACKDTLKEPGILNFSRGKFMKIWGSTDIMPTRQFMSTLYHCHLHTDNTEYLHNSSSIGSGELVKNFMNIHCRVQEILLPEENQGNPHMTLTPHP